MRTHSIEHYQALRDSVSYLFPVPPHLLKDTKLELGSGAHLGTSSSANHTAAASHPTGLNLEGSQLAASLKGKPGPTPAGKTLPHSYPEYAITSGIIVLGISSNDKLFDGEKKKVHTDQQIAKGLNDCYSSSSDKA